MRRDPDLIREILLQVEATPAGCDTGEVQIPGRDQLEVSAHVALLIDAQLIKGVYQTSGQGGIRHAVAFDLTWKGHDFVELSREPRRWERAKNTVKQKGGGFTIEVLSGVLSKLTMSAMGLD